MLFLRNGDIIIAINGASLEHLSYAEMLMALRNVSDLATLRVYRRDELEPEIAASTNSLFLPEIPPNDVQRRYDGIKIIAFVR